MVILSTWFASNLLIVHGRKTQAMILGNPFQEAVLHKSLENLLFFKKRNNLFSKFLMTLDTNCITLKL